MLIFKKPQLYFIHIIGLLLTYISGQATGQTPPDCPAGTSVVDYVSKINGERKVWCQKSSNGTFVKHGPEKVFKESGELIGSKYYLNGVESAPPETVKTLEIPKDSYTSIISVGTSHACYLLNNQEKNVMCFGENQWGELGNGNAQPSFTPTKVLSPDGKGHLSGVKGIFATSMRTCAVLLQGEVACWGKSMTSNIEEKLTIPRLVLNEDGTVLKGIVQVAVSPLVTCGLTEGKDVFCWGKGDGASLGIKTRSNRLFPPTKVTALDVSTKKLYDSPWHLCSLSDVGDVHCWGGNHCWIWGGENVKANTPKLIPEFKDHVVDVAIGGQNLATLTDEGEVYVWHPVNRTLGHTKHYKISKFAKGIKKISSSDHDIDSLCALTESGSLDCLKKITLEDSIKKTKEELLKELFYFNCLEGDPKLLEENKRTFDSYSGGLDHSVYRKIEKDVLDFDMGDNMSCAVLMNGKLYCWSPDAKITEELKKVEGHGVDGP